MLCLAALLATGAGPPSHPQAAAVTVTAPIGSQFQSDTAHTGVQANSGVAPPLGMRWGVNLAQPPSYAIVGGGHVFVTISIDINQEGLVALNESDGSTFFGPVPLGVESSGHYAGLAYDEGRVFTNTASCVITAVDATTGAIAWQETLNESDCSGPVTASNGIIFISTLGSVTALSEVDGHQLWINTDNGASPGSPAYTGDGVYVGMAAQFNDAAPADGTTIWHFDGHLTGGSGRTTPVTGGRDYARTDGTSGYVLGAATGAQLATFTSFNVPAVDATQAYYQTDLTTGVNRVSCVDTCRLEAHRVSDQAKVWSFDGDGNLDTPPMELDGTVYIGSASGTIYGVSAQTGQPVWSGSTTLTDGVIRPYDEHNSSENPAALGAGDGMLFVAFGTTLVAYQHAAPGTVPAFEYHFSGDNATLCPGHGTVIDHGCAWPFQQAARGNDYARVDITSGDQPAALSIVDASGQTVARATGSGPTIELWASALAPGSYTLQVRTTDPSVQLHTMFSAYLAVDTPGTPPPPPPSSKCSSVTISAMPASPMASGTQVTFTAAASSCPNARYEFWMRPASQSSWQLVQAYSASTTFSWNSTGAAPGTVYFGVHARDASSTADFDALASMPYSVTVPSCSSVGITASPSSVSSGTHVTVTAIAPYCADPNPLYEFWLRPASSSMWQMVRAYSTSTTYDWNSTGAAAGTVYLGVHIKDARSSNAYDAVASTSVTVTTTACKSVTISVNPTTITHSSSNGTHVTATASAAGCTNSALYEFWIRPASSNTWQLVQAYGTSNTYDWNSTGALPGTVYIGVHVKDANSSSAYDAVASAPVAVN